MAWIWIFIANLSSTRAWKQPNWNLIPDEKLHYSHKVEYYTVAKRMKHKLEIQFSNKEKQSGTTTMTPLYQQGLTSFFLSLILTMWLTTYLLQDGCSLSNILLIFQAERSETVHSAAFQRKFLKALTIGFYFPLFGQNHIE